MPPPKETLALRCFMAVAQWLLQPLAILVARFQPRHDGADPQVSVVDHPVLRFVLLTFSPLLLWSGIALCHGIFLSVLSEGAFLIVISLAMPWAMLPIQLENHLPPAFIFPLIVLLPLVLNIGLVCATMRSRIAYFAVLILYLGLNASGVSWVLSQMAGV